MCDQKDDLEARVERLEQMMLVLHPILGAASVCYAACLFKGGKKAVDTFDELYRELESIKRDDIKHSGEGESGS